MNKKHKNRLDVPNKNRGGNALYHPNPSKKKIAELCQQIQLGWSEEERKFRELGLVLDKRGYRRMSNAAMQELVAQAGYTIQEIKM